MTDLPSTEYDASLETPENQGFSGKSRGGGVNYNPLYKPQVHRRPSERNRFRDLLTPNKGGTTKKCARAGVTMKAARTASGSYAG